MENLYRRSVNNNVLFQAVLENNLNLVIQFLDEGMAADTKGLMNTTPLIIASYCGFKDIVKELLDRGANTNLQTIDSYTALYGACKHGHTEIVKLLIAKNANVNYITGMNDSPLYVAAENGHTEIVSILIQNKVNLNFTNFNLNMTALYGAACEGHITIVANLLNSGADPTIKHSITGLPAAHAAGLLGQNDTSYLISEYINAMDENHSIDPWQDSKIL